MFVVETILSSQFAWVSVFSSSNLSLKHAYVKFPKLSIVRFVFGYAQIRAIIYNWLNNTSAQQFYLYYIKSDYMFRPFMWSSSGP